MKLFFRGIMNYLLFFLMAAFLVTCSIMLFTNALMDSLHITLTGENLNIAAKLTFINVLILSLLFTVFDAIRRKLTIERTANRIAEAAKRIVAGDFSVRVPLPNRFGSGDSFREIVDCFNTMAKELSGVETLRTDFISNVSHEMKTPMAAINNYAALMKSADLTDDRRVEYARGITENIRRLSDMMSNILRLNKLENQQIFPDAEQYNLSEQLCEALLRFENVWEEKGIEIETDISQDVGIYADRELLSLVWNNLLSNAFKFTPVGGTVKVLLDASKTHAVVRVQDTGIGMSPETGAHIFEKFYQGDASRVTNGNGLGLALVKRVMDIVHGEICVESAVGEGSVFTVKIRRQ